MTCFSLGLLDVFTGLSTLKICTAYKIGDNIIEDLPTDLANRTDIEPVYEELEGWNEDITGARSLEDLPAACLKYIHRVEELIGIPVAAISVGPAREQTIMTPGILPGIS